LEIYKNSQDKTFATPEVERIIPEVYRKSFTIIIPAYNEIKRISPVLNDVCSFIYENDLPWEVIVSIDGNDGTDNLVNEMIIRFPFLTYTKGKGRDGKGAAIKRAISIASGEYFILMDADNSVSFREIYVAIPEIENNDVVILERYSSERNHIPFFRRFASRGFNILVQSLLGLRVSDTQSGYKIIRSELAKRSFDSMTVTNTFFDVAFLFKVKQLGGRIKEKPVVYSHDGESKFNVVSEVFGQGMSLLAFRIRYSPIYKHIPESLKNLYYKKFRWI
jgi:glycosyltransferase involved in cell wall biosynthesis